MTLALLIATVGGAWAQSTNPEPIELKPDETGKKWILADMPASNIELQVEYEPTKVTMAANDKTMGTVEVGGESKVEWTADTWAGWNSGQNTEMTKSDGGITMTYTNAADHTYDGRIREIENSHALEFFINEHIDDCTVTFSSDEGNISRIELSMTEEYFENTIPGTTFTYGNPHILPLDGWTFSGKSAVWEGEATKSLTLKSCSTTVSKITFFKGAIPDGVTINSDGTFTVAKTATVTLTATPAEGYKFLYWEDDQTNTNPVREVTIESGMADMTYKAVFAEITYNVTFVEGTDLNEWSATPNTAAKNTGVKVTYSGAKKVIGVKAEKKAEKKTSKSPSEVTAEDIFKVIASDGMIYDNVDAAESAGTVAQGLIVYVGSATEHATYNHGLALALKDENSNTWGGAKDACNAKNTSTPIVGALWMLPSQGQWNTMFNAVGGDCKLRDCFSSAGGNNILKNGIYWSSTGDSQLAMFYMFTEDDWEGSWGDVQPYYNNNYNVRACIVF